MRNIAPSYGAIVALALALVSTASAQQALFPTYSLISEKTAPAELGSDIAASSFTDETGQYRFINSAADYEQSNSGGSFVNTFTADNFATLANGQRNLTTYNTYWNSTSSYC